MLSRTAAFAIAASVLLLDRLTKVWVERTIELWQEIQVIPGFFNLVHAKNRGAAFGMFSDNEHPLRTVLLVGVSSGALAFVAYLLLKPGAGQRGGFGANRLTGAGLALVLGGALGNMYDRIVHGQVTDFLDFFYGTWHFAAFNVADSAITVGAGFLLLDMWRTRKDQDAPQAH